LTLLEELKGNIHKLDDDKFLAMTSHGSTTASQGRRLAGRAKAT
jgi:hypothetical protein